MKTYISNNPRVSSSKRNRQPHSQNNTSPTLPMTPLTTQPQQVLAMQQRFGN